MATFGNLETEVEPLAGLMRDHTEVDQLVERTREVLESALAAPDDSALTATALDVSYDLDAYLANDLVIHIAKEEDVLFPALRAIAADIDKVIDEMVEQHDEIRMRQAAVERAVAAMDHSHDEVEAEQAALSARLAAVQTTGATPEALGGLLDCVKRLHWILQGHFGDEEDDLFAPALELLSAEEWTELAQQASALDR